MEYLDVFDENMDLCGSALREEVHQKGYWHQTFQCWFLSKEDDKFYILFQKRHQDKDTFPNLLDITTAGHLISGETPEDGIRELEEELGIKVEFSELISIGIIKEKKMHKNFTDCEFCNVFLYENVLPLESFKLQKDEVTGIFKIELDDFIKLIDDQAAVVNASGIEYDIANGMQQITIDVTKNDIVPHSDEYYKKVYSSAKKYLASRYSHI